MSLLSCRDVFVCRTCLGHNCSVEEKFEFKRGEDVLEEVEKFCYLGDLISCYGGASEAVSARIGSAWKKFREWCVSWEAGFIFEGNGGRFINAVLDQFCCTVVKCGNLLRMHEVERHMIKMMCKVRLIDRVSTDVLCDRVGVVFKAVCSGKVMSCMGTSIPKYMRLWMLK